MSATTKPMTGSYMEQILPVIQSIHGWGFGIMNTQAMVIATDGNDQVTCFQLFKPETDCAGFGLTLRKTNHDGLWMLTPVGCSVCSATIVIVGGNTLDISMVDYSVPLKNDKTRGELIADEMEEAGCFKKSDKS